MNYSGLKEGALVAKSKRGDTLAFEELLRRSQGKLYGWCLSFCKNEFDAEECYQKTTIKCWKNIKKFKGKSKFLTWACCIARNSFYDSWRKSKRRPTISLDALTEAEGAGQVEQYMKDFSVDSSGNVNEVDSKEMVKLIKDKLNKISPQHKEALVLFVEEGYQYQEIAKKQKCPVGTVMSRIYYAKREARKYLKGVYNNEFK